VDFYVRFTKQAMPTFKYYLILAFSNLDNDRRLYASNFSPDCFRPTLIEPNPTTLTTKLNELRYNK
jgi:hypothetical protein